MRHTIQQFTNIERQAVEAAKRLAAQHGTLATHRPMGSDVRIVLESGAKQFVVTFAALCKGSPAMAVKDVLADVAHGLRTMGVWRDAATPKVPPAPARQAYGTRQSRHVPQEQPSVEFPEF